MIKHKKYIVSFLLMAISISCMNYIPVFAEEQTKISEESVYDEGKTGKDKNNITWSYEKKSNGTLSIWQHDELKGNVEIPEKIDGCNVSEIRKYGISENEKITSVKIPGTVNKIGESAFFGCKNLKAVEIPESVNSIGSNAFENTSWLDNERKKNQFVVVNNILIDGRSASGDIVIPDNVVEIGDGAFAYIDVENKYQYGNGTSITSLKIPVGVKRIGRDSFATSPNLTHIEIPITVTEVGAGAFSACPVDRTILC